MTNRNHEQSKLLKKCKSAKKRGLSTLQLKIVNRHDLEFLRNHYTVKSIGKVSWYTVHLN